jgi:hypothetical protein
MPSRPTEGDGLTKAIEVPRSGCLDDAGVEMFGNGARPDFQDQQGAFRLEFGAPVFHRPRARRVPVGIAVGEVVAVPAELQRMAEAVVAHITTGTQPMRVHHPGEIIAAIHADATIRVVHISLVHRQPGAVVRHGHVGVLEPEIGLIRNARPGLVTHAPRGHQAALARGRAACRDQ